LPEGADKLTVIGASVVPEFGVVTILIFIVALSSMIILHARNTQIWSI
jgi:predicted secreted protein with PEFG-CTERM motif